jgi:hypothetical protein
MRESGGDDGKVVKGLRRSWEKLVEVELVATTRRWTW